MKAAVLILCVTLAGLLSVWSVEAFILAEPEPEPETEAEPFPSERFPIVTRIELPRDYGFFIGDEIPLTVIIEASPDAVLDLVNLPRAGEQHGQLEIRHFKLTSTVRADRTTTYQAAYRMQYFGIAPFTISFEPLEILYAARQDRDEIANAYHYKSLFTQSVSINISRIGPYRSTPALEPKGPLHDRRTVFFWIPIIGGALCMVAAFGGLGRESWQVWKQWSGAEADALTAAEKTLERLRRGEATPALSAESLAPAVSHLGAIVRAYLQDACGISAYTLTPSELAARLEASQQVQDVVGLLQRCETLKYQPDETSEAEEHFLWEEAVTLFERLD
jgi:hypothetical protein